MSNPAYLFGVKLANAITFYERQPADKQKKKNPLMRAEAAGDNPNAILDDSDDKEIMDKESAAYKFGKSMCHTYDMSKHDRSKYQTGPMRALAAEECVKPADGGVTETQETEHSEKDIAHSGQKMSGYKQAAGGLGKAFGKMMSAATGALPAKPPLPKPPLPKPPTKVTVSPTEAAAGRAKITITPEEIAARSATPATRTPAGTALPEWLRNNRATARGIDPKTGVRPGAVAPTPAPPTPPPRDYGRVPTGPIPTAQAQSFFDNATSGGRQRMLGIDPQGRGVPAAPQRWEQLSEAQRAAVQRFYSGGQ